MQAQAQAQLQHLSPLTSLPDGMMLRLALLQEQWSHLTLVAHVMTLLLETRLQLMLHLCSHASPRLEELAAKLPGQLQPAAQSLLTLHPLMMVTLLARSPGQVVQ